MFSNRTIGYKQTTQGVVVREYSHSIASFNVSNSTTYGCSNTPTLVSALHTSGRETPQNTSTTPLTANNCCTLTNASAAERVPNSHGDHDTDDRDVLRPILTPCQNQTHSSLQCLPTHTTLRVPRRLLHKIDTENENQSGDNHDSYMCRASIQDSLKVVEKGPTNVCYRPSADDQEQKRGDSEQKSSDAIPHTIKSAKKLSTSMVMQGKGLTRAC